MAISDLLHDLSSAAFVAAEYIGHFLNSAFMLSLVGALAGATAGALTAQRVIERARSNDSLLKEIRNTNAAIMISFNICNSALILKNQIVSPMYEQFLEAQQAFRLHQTQLQSGQNGSITEFHFQADLQGFAPPTLPTESLKSLVFEKISVTGKPLSLMALVEQSYIGLKESVETRERIVQDLKVLPAKEFPFHYFGERLPSGNIPREYATIVLVICGHLDDLIFFSAQLSEQLAGHGETLRGQYKTQSRKDGPIVHAPDYSTPREKGLFPNAHDYELWTNWFKEI